MINETAESLEYLVKLGYVKGPSDWNELERKFPVVRKKIARNGDEGEIEAFAKDKCISLKTDAEDRQIPILGECDGKASKFRYESNFSVKGFTLSNAESSSDLAVEESSKNIARILFGDFETKPELRKVEFVEGKGDYWLIKLGRDSKCLGIAGDNPVDDAALEVSDCSEKDSQKWYWVPFD